MSEQVRDLPRRERLGWRLMGITLLLACAIGMTLNIGQILFDSRSQSAEIDRSVKRLLAVMREPATEAVYNIDDRLARRVLDGVFRFEGIISAELVVGDSEVLASDKREQVVSAFRFVTAALFGDRRDYRIELKTGSGETVGSLRLQLDTYPPGRAFLARAGVVLALGMLNAGLLALLLLAVFNYFLTRPLVRMVDGLSSFDPNMPESIRLDVPAGHERDELGLWARSVNNLLAAIRENLARQREAETRASWLEHFDTLTGLANRTLLLANTTHSMAGATQDDEPAIPLAIVIVDIREFRDVNAQYGVDFGDDVLREAAQRLNVLGAGNAALTARLAEDAFAFLLSGENVRSHAEALARSLHSMFESPLEVGAKSLLLALDIGVAIYPDDAQSADQLIQNAERALSYAKKNKLTDAQFYQAEHDKELQLHKRLVRDLRCATQRDEIQLHYQPLVGAQNGQVVAVEALARWTHPELGNVAPVEFVPLAESSGQIVALGEWLLRRACHDAALWRRVCKAPPRVAVNVSAMQLRERGFDLIVASALADARLPASLLELEITETALIENIEQAIGMLQRLRASGVRISIDDFGTGLASLSYLKRLPIDQLKIDISFIRDVLRDPSDAQIVKAIINLGHSLDLEVVAEGVEEPAQRDFLAANGCDLMQGYLFAMPMDMVAFTSYLQRHSSSRSVVVPINGGRSSV
ncbi:MAG: putative bifunctional diguanylate cyclase/phosphodiesterase [Arenimonas sp.]